MSRPPLFSVLIPARNQRQRLTLTLDSIGRAHIDPGRVEVIVVDDGSNDGTYGSLGERRDAFDLKTLRVDYGSQSATTNEALRHATGEYVLCSAQDILFDPDLFTEHLEWHRRFSDEEAVVLGYLPYPQEIEVTPFMFYLVSGGYQFAYYLIRDPLNVPPNFLYAPNFSARRGLLVEAGGFDERFPYGCQDTDLGIRLTQRGARILYNPDAIGYHNHPMVLDEYLGRQRRIGAAVMHLQDKHPEYEGGPGIYDLILHQYLMCSDVRLDRAFEQVRRLERELLDHGPGYQRLWSSAFCRSRPLNEFSEPEQATIRTVERLFKAYHTILGFHWAEGFFVESLEVHGPERVERRLTARLAKMQASIPVRKTVERRLHDHRIERELCSARDYRFSLIVHDVDDYRRAGRFLESFENPPAGRCNVQVVMVIDPTDFTDRQLDRLRGMIDLAFCSRSDNGVMEALERCETDIVSVLSAKVEPIHPDTQRVAERLLTRVPRVAVIGGSVTGGSGPRRRYGYRLDGASLTGSADAAPGATPIDVVVPECCWFRKSVVTELLTHDTSATSAPWNFRICRLAAEADRPVIHVPQLAVRPVEPPAREMSPA